ncbi:MAG TPA: S9 family peptidase [Candidatus Aminicenantes bacterium]|nr:S9 family peptidase [Candidatus Aminicenantes bacterium]
MKKNIIAVVFVLALSLPALPAADEPLPSPPLAKKVPKELVIHGHARQDDYYWLNQRENPEVIEYLRAENAYTDAVMKPAQGLRGTLYREMVGRLKPDDSSVPYFENGYWYAVRYEKGRDYPVYTRRKGSLKAAEKVLLDGNRMAAGEKYFQIGSIAVSPDNAVLAYSVDTVSRRQYRIRFRDLRSGRDLAEEIRMTAGRMAWAADSRTLFYPVIDPETLRAYKVCRHRLGSAAASDAAVYEEKDETFDVGVGLSRSRRFLLLSSRSTLSDEYRFLDAARPEGAFTVFQPRRRGLEYSIDHLDGRFFVLTNDGAENFKLMTAAEGRTGRDSWTELVAHRPDVLLEDFDLFARYLVLSERRAGLTQLRVLPWGEREGYAIEFPEPAYTVGTSFTAEPDTDLMRFTYTSLTVPPSTYEFDMKTRQRRLLKRQEVLGGYRPELYAGERLMAPAYDGTLVPISLVYRKDTARGAGTPLLLYGYGSYGYSTDPEFNSARLSLLDRGFIFAIAHVRGGQELGRSWYDNGKLFKKMNTFTDFISCAEYLVRHGYTSPPRLFATGGSAGGLLMGAVANLRPDLFRGIVAAVPFVDVVTTMLDTSIPLTTSEYDEWGDPNRPECYEYMLSYSPYDNVRAKDYPAMLVTTGLHDSQVQYFEPAKWVARLRSAKTDDRLLLLRTNMEAGHGGASGRFRRLEEVAFEYAFLLQLAGGQSSEK